jgi:response regulator RpfG family c-di-GMP phosphodiesterase
MCPNLPTHQASDSLILAQALGLDDEAIRIVADGALLHEIGKLAMPDVILLKRAKWTRERNAS